MFIIITNNYISITKPIKHNIIRLSDFLFKKKMFSSLFSVSKFKELWKIIINLTSIINTEIAVVEDGLQIIVGP